jgi:hypothetical protein
MNNKLFAVIIAVLVITAQLIAIPVSADDGRKITSKKVGDIVVMSKNVVATYQGKTASGRDMYKATISAPKYQDDLQTLISSEWKDRSGGRYVNGDNSGYFSVNGNEVELLYKGNQMIWTPTLSVGGKTLKASAPSLLAVDPINMNYSNNTIEWVYGDGIVRHLRQIEGVVMDIYIFDSAPAGDIVIIEQIEKTKGYSYDAPAYAMDADGKQIKITTYGNKKTVKLDDLKGVKYPITVDPTVNYITSANDGVLNGYDVSSYATAHNSTSGTSYYSAVNSYVGQYRSGTQYNIHRLAFYFDTSALPDDAVITAASLSLYGKTDDSDQDFNMQITNGQSTYPHSPMIDSDYSYLNYTGNGGTLTSAGFTTVGYNSIPLNATGMSWITATGITKLYVVSDRDYTSTPPANLVDEELMIWMYEKGSGYQPKLDITFTIAVPTVTTNAATAVVCTSATLNGSIDNTGGDLVTKQGFVWDTSTHTEPTSVTAPAASAYTWNDMHTDAAGYPLGDYTHNLAGLTEGDTYYVRFVGYNSGGYKYSDEIEFTCWSDPVISTSAATEVGTTTANLQSHLTDAGGDTCQVRFGYGTTDQGVNIAAYDHFSTYEGTYETGAHPMLSVTGLVANTLYYFNVQVQNDCGATTGTALTFTTESSVGSPTNAVVIPTFNTVTLTWTKGTGATTTIIRFKANACPTSETDGTLIYSSTASTYVHTGLIPGTDYCYYIRGYEPTIGYSTTSIVIHATTLAGVAEVITHTNIPTQPSKWSIEPDATNVAAHNPLAPGIADIATSTGMPLNYLWFGLYMLGVIGGAIVVGRLSRGSHIAVVAAIVILMSFGSAINLVSIYFTVFVAVIAIALLVVEKRGTV